jgi:predicted nucleic acid-binding protein
LSSKAEIQRSLRRLKPSTRREALSYRERSALPFVVAAMQLPGLLLDTTVYIDELQGKLPPDVDVVLRSTSLWHSTVTESELAALAGLLDPAHPESGKAVDQVLASIEQRPAHRILNPDREVWREAGILAGLLARLQQYGKGERRKALNDALIFLSAAKAGVVVLTRNVLEFDLLMQLVPRGKAIFYSL